MKVLLKFFHAISKFYKPLDSKIHFLFIVYVSYWTGQDVVKSHLPVLVQPSCGQENKRGHGWIWCCPW